MGRYLSIVADNKSVGFTVELRKSWNCYSQSVQNIRMIEPLGLGALELVDVCERDIVEDDELIYGLETRFYSTRVDRTHLCLKMCIRETVKSQSWLKIAVYCWKTWEICDQKRLRLFCAREPLLREGFRNLKSKENGLEHAQQLLFQPERTRQGKPN